MHEFGLSQGAEEGGADKVLDPVVNVASEGEQGAEGDGQREGETREEEARQVHAPPIPVTPTLEEVRQHRLTHTPFRSWCPHCVRGKGREDRHSPSKQKGVYMGIPKIVSDYFFVGRRRPQGKEDRAHD